MTTFSDLQTQIRQYTETSSDVLTDTVVNDFILQAELRIFREVDLDCFRSYQFTTLSVMKQGFPQLTQQVGLV